MATTTSITAAVDWRAMDSLPIGEYVVGAQGATYIVAALAQQEGHCRTYEARSSDGARHVWLHEGLSPLDLSGVATLSKLTTNDPLSHVANLLPPFSMTWFDGVVRHYVPEVIVQGQMSETDLGAQSKKKWELWLEHLVMGLHELHKYGVALDLRDEATVLTHVGVVTKGKSSNRDDVVQWQRLARLTPLQEKPDAQYADVRALAGLMARTKLLEAPSHVRYALQAAAKPGGRVSAARLLSELGSSDGRTDAIQQSSATQRGLRVDTGHATSRGMVREENEDSLCAMDVTIAWRVNENGVLPTHAPVLLAVADGMGGIEAGEVASALTIKMLKAATAELFASTDKRVAMAKSQLHMNEWIQVTTQDINAAVVAEGAKHGNQMGSTLAFALVMDGVAYLGHVGDSRIYRWHPKHNKGKLIRLVKDHSLVQALVDAGVMSDEERYSHSERSVISRSLGDPKTGWSDANEPVPVQRGDWLLVCSDGLWEMVRDDAIRDVLAHAPNAQVACDRLVDLANANGGEDNISVVIGRFL